MVITIRQESPNFIEKTGIVSLLCSLFKAFKQITSHFLGQNNTPVLLQDNCLAVKDLAHTEHRLMLKSDDSIRCVACMLCETACPVHCINIETEPLAKPQTPVPLKFTIDQGRCLSCGLCVTACPYDAIRMDTGKLPLPQKEQNEIKDLDYLIKNHGDKSPYSVVE